MKRLPLIGAFLLATNLFALPRYITVSSQAGRDAAGGLPTIASDGSQYLVAFRDSRNSENGYDIYAARVSAAGEVLDPEGIPIAVGPNYDQNPGNQYVPSAAFDGTNYFVVWVENRAADSVDYEIYGARVTPEGTVLDPGGIRITTGADPLRMPGIAFDGTNYLIVWRSGGTVYGIRATKSGTPLGDPAGFVIGSGFYPAVAFDGTNFLVVWHGGGQIQGALVDTSGNLIKSPFSVSTNGDNADHATVAFNGTNYLVGWWDGRGGDAWNGGGAWAARVKPDGTVLDVPSIQISRYARNQPPVVVASDGEDFVVTWQTDLFLGRFRQVDAFGRIVRNDGSLSKPFSIGTHYWHQWAPSLGSNGTSYLSVWAESGNRDCQVGCVRGRIFEPAFIPSSSGEAAVPDPPWTAVPSPTGGDLRTATAIGRDTFAAGGEGGMHVFNGSSWTTYTDVPFIYGSHHSANGTLLSYGGCFAISAHFGSVAGSDCLDFATQSRGYGYSIFGGAAEDFIAVGTDGVAQHYNGHSWVVRDTGTINDLHGVWGTASVKYAAGEFGTILKWDGTSWTSVATPTEQTLSDVWGTSLDDIFVVGDFGTILHFDGADWTLQATPTDEILTAITGFGHDHIYAVGRHGTILRYNGTAWIAESSGTTENLTDVAVQANNVWVTGERGTLLKKTVPLVGADPVGVTATAITQGRVDVSWNAAIGATSYQVYRREAGEELEQIAGPSGTSLSMSDTSVSPDKAYLYAVRAVYDDGVSGNSTADLATTVIFTDGPLMAGVVVKAVHLSQLRTAVNAVRELAGLPAFSFTDPAIAGTTIKAVHLTELRAAISAARGGLGLPTGGFTDSSPDGVPVRALHFQQLRNRVQ